MRILPCGHTDTQAGQLLRNASDKDMIDILVLLSSVNKRIEFLRLNNV